MARIQEGNGILPSHIHDQSPDSASQTTIRKVDRSNANEICQAIIADGCCIITNFTDAETVGKVNAETKPFLDDDKPWEVCSIQHARSKCDCVLIDEIL